MIVLGLTGKMMAGKTAFANILEKHFGFKRVAFGDILKDMVVEAGLLTRKQVKEKDDYSRFILQRVGTEIIRRVDPDYFVKQMRNRITNEWKKVPRLVIDDIRFVNEAQLCRMFSGIVAVVHRPELEQVNPLTQHLSEQEQRKIETSIVINNDGTIGDLREKAFLLFDREGRLRCS